MNIITKKYLSRQTTLRGIGASLCLPWLDAMHAAAVTEKKQAVKPVKRLGFYFVPMGSDLSRWKPKSKKDLSQLNVSMKSLEPIKHKVNVFSNLQLRPAYPGSHATSNSAFLSAASAKLTESSDYYLGTTIDQVAAKVIGQDTKLPSIELAMDMMENVGQCDNGYACVYQNNISWSSPTSPLPSEAHPRLVFEKLFGEGGTKEQRKAALKRRASLLDLIMTDMKALNAQLGKQDQHLIHNYLDTIREVERRIQKSESSIDKNQMQDLERPIGVPDKYSEHAKLMFDLQALALQADVTRVISFQMAREASNRSYTEIGVPEPHHPLSHHGNSPEKIKKLAKINAFHLSLFSDFIQKLDGIKEAGTSLLDQSLLLYGSGMGNPHHHDHSNLPILLAGGMASGIIGNRHFDYSNPTPLANLHLGILEKSGVVRETFGDSVGAIVL